MLSVGALALACPRAGSRLRNRSTPVLLVHGMFADHHAMEPLRNALRMDGFIHLDAVDLRPVDGSVGLAVLATQLDAAARALLRRTRASRLDVVGYSLGAMVARYWIQRNSGQIRTRRFISIAGPHHGVIGGLFSGTTLAGELRPASAMLASLDRDNDPWGPVEVASFFSPLDLVIVPTETTILRKSRVIRGFLAPTHHHMATDSHVLRAVCEVLSSQPMAVSSQIPEPAALTEQVRHAVRTRSLHR